MIAYFLFIGMVALVVVLAFLRRGEGTDVGGNGEVSEESDE